MMKLGSLLALCGLIGLRYDLGAAGGAILGVGLLLLITEWFNPQLRADGKTLKNVADELIAKGAIGKIILVAPSTGGNHSDLDPGIVNMLRPDLSDDEGIGTGAFEDYFFQDLIPHIDTSFRTIPKRCARGIDGFSLGGYTSTLYALKHPSVFSSVGSYEGTLMWYDLDYPFSPGPLDDNIYLSPDFKDFFSPMFDQPFDIEYMKAHNATNILVEADAVRLDSIQQLSFHISAGFLSNVTNGYVNKQFVDSLASKGISNSFDNVALEPTAVHTYEWADQHAKTTLVKHWETFASLGCNGIVLKTSNRAQSPPVITLFQNSPNPVSSTTMIGIELLERRKLYIDIINSFGQKIKRLLRKEYPSGRHQIQINLSDLPDGVYYYRLKSEDQIHTKKLLVLKGK